MAQAAGPGQHANRVPHALLRYAWPDQVELAGQALQDVGWVTPPGPNGGGFLGFSSTRPSTCPFAGMTAFFVDQVTADLPLGAVSAVGETFALHRSKDGKEMLATLPDPFIETIIDRSSAARTDKAITTSRHRSGRWPGSENWLADDGIIAASLARFAQNG